MPPDDLIDNDDDKIGQDDWEQKYKTLQGMHQADQQRLATELQARDQRLASMEQTLANVQGQNNAISQMVRQNENKPEPMLNSELIEGAGPEVTQYVEAVLHDHISPYLNEISNLRQQIGQVGNAYQHSQAQLDAIRQDAQRANETHYYAHLKSSVPGYEQVNVDPKFMEWLQKPDDFTGRTRREILGHAHQAQDAQMVSNMFNSYLRDSGGNNAGAIGMNNSYHSQIAPPRGYGTPPRNGAANGNGRQWTRDEISKFYADKTSGSLNMDAEKIAATERDIFRASAEGRIDT